MYDHESTIALIEERFPHLSEEIHDEIWDGLLHLQMAVLSHWAQAIIDAGDETNWNRITTTFLELWQDCSDDVKNALNVSILEHLDFRDQNTKRSWAYKAMPITMRIAKDGIDAYNKKITQQLTRQFRRTPSAPLIFDVRLIHKPHIR